MCATRLNEYKVDSIAVSLFGDISVEIYKQKQRQIQSEANPKTNLMMRTPVYCRVVTLLFSNRQLMHR